MWWKMLTTISKSPKVKSPDCIAPFLLSDYCSTPNLNIFTLLNIYKKKSKILNPETAIREWLAFSLNNFVSLSSIYGQSFNWLISSPDLFRLLWGLCLALCEWECGGISRNLFCLLFGLEIASVIKAPPEVTACWFDEGCQRWREWAWYSKKRPLYHQLIALLCIPPVGAGLVFFPLYHTLSQPSLSLACSFAPSLSVIPPS